MQDGLGVKIKAFSVDFLSFRKEDKKKKKKKQRKRELLRGNCLACLHHVTYIIHIFGHLFYFVCVQIHMYIFPVGIFYFHVICEVRYFM